MSKFQSSSGPGAGCNALPLINWRDAQTVSILIRPRGRMQPSAPDRKPRAGPVSILIRPRGRMQRRLVLGMRSAGWFQSSSGPGAGCNLLVNRAYADFRKFQSSSGPGAGCNGIEGKGRTPIVRVSILIRPRGRMQPRWRSGWRTWKRSRFNPHPAQGPDATAAVPRGMAR